MRGKRARVTVQARRVRWCQLPHRLREILFWRWRPLRTTGELFGSGSITGFDGFEIENCPAQTIAIVEKVIIATSGKPWCNHFFLGSWMIWKILIVLVLVLPHIVFLFIFFVFLCLSVHIYGNFLVSFFLPFSLSVFLPLGLRIRIRIIFRSWIRILIRVKS